MQFQLEKSFMFGVQWNSSSSKAINKQGDLHKSKRSFEHREAVVTSRFIQSALFESR